MESKDAKLLSYMFRFHPEVEIRRWAKELSYFRFVRAQGGMANDGDELAVRLGFDGEADLHQALKELGVTLNRMSPGEKRPAAWDPNVMVPKSEIAGFEHLEQAGFQEIAGQRVFVWVNLLTIRLAIADSYEVSEKEFTAAKQVEPLLTPLKSRIIDPPSDQLHCICPKYYPEFFL